METMIAGFKEVLGQGFVNATLHVHVGKKRIFNSDQNRRKLDNLPSIAQFLCKIGPNKKK